MKNDEKCTEYFIFPIPEVVIKGIQDAEAQIKEHQEEIANFMRKNYAKNKI